MITDTIANAASYLSFSRGITAAIEFLQNRISPDWHRVGMRLTGTGYLPLCRSIKRKPRSRHSGDASPIY